MMNPEAEDSTSPPHDADTNPSLNSSSSSSFSPSSPVPSLSPSRSMSLSPSASPPSPTHHLRWRAQHSLNTARLALLPLTQGLYRYHAFSSRLANPSTGELRHPQPSGEERMPMSAEATREYRTERRRAGASRSEPVVAVRRAWGLNILNMARSRGTRRAVVDGYSSREEWRRFRDRIEIGMRRLGFVLIFKERKRKREGEREEEEEEEEVGKRVDEGHDTDTDVFGDQSGQKEEAGSADAEGAGEEKKKKTPLAEEADPNPQATRRRRKHDQSQPSSSSPFTSETAVNAVNISNHILARNIAMGLLPIPLPPSLPLSKSAPNNLAPAYVPAHERTHNLHQTHTVHIPSAPLHCRGQGAGNSCATGWVGRRRHGRGRMRDGEERKEGKERSQKTETEVTDHAYEYRNMAPIMIDDRKAMEPARRDVLHGSVISVAMKNSMVMFLMDFAHPGLSHHLAAIEKRYTAARL